MVGKLIDLNCKKEIKEVVMNGLKKIQRKHFVNGSLALFVCLK